MVSGHLVLLCVGQGTLVAGCPVVAGTALLLVSDRGLEFRRLMPVALVGVGVDVTLTLAGVFDFDSATIVPGWLILPCGGCSRLRCTEASPRLGSRRGWQRCLAASPCPLTTWWEPVWARSRYPWVRCFLFPCWSPSGSFYCPCSFASVIAWRLPRENRSPLDGLLPTLDRDRVGRRRGGRPFTVTRAHRCRFWAVGAFQ